MKRAALIAVLLLLLLCGCAEGSGGATSGNADPLPPSASPADTRPVVTAETLLLEDEGRWRSEQQSPEEEIVVVRELELATDGSFRYREGDYASEFSYFAAGRWALDGDRLSLQAEETDEDGNSLGTAPFVAEYTVAFDNGTLAMTQLGEPGLCGSPSGQTVYYYHE